MLTELVELYMNVFDAGVPDLILGEAKSGVVVAMYCYDFSPLCSSCAYCGLSYPVSHSYFHFVNHVTFLSTITLLFIIICRRGSLHPYPGL